MVKDYPIVHVRSLAGVNTTSRTGPGMPTVSPGCVIEYLSDPRIVDKTVSIVGMRMPGAVP